VLIDLGAGESSIEIVGGPYRSRTRGRGGSFVAEFSKPFTLFGAFHQNQPKLDGARVRRDDTTQPASRSQSGSYAGCYLPILHPRLASRFASASRRRATFEAAQERLTAESTSFDDVRHRAPKCLERETQFDRGQSGTEKERMLFYFHTLQLLAHTAASLPTKATTFAGEARAMELPGMIATARFAFWDTGRNQIVLLTLLEPDLKTNILRTHLEIGARIRLDAYVLLR